MYVILHFIDPNLQWRQETRLETRLEAYILSCRLLYGEVRVSGVALE